MNVNIINILESDLRLLCNDSRTKYPEIKQLAERVLLKLRTLFENETKDPKELKSSSEFIIRPFLAACATKNSKLVLFSLSSIQRILSANLLTSSTLSSIIGTLRIQAESQDDSISLKILQTLSLIFTSSSYSLILESSISQSLSLAFRLLSSDSQVVHNTSSAILLQILMLIFENGQASMEAKPYDYEQYNSSNVFVTNDNIERSITGMAEPTRIAFLTLRDLCAINNKQSALWMQLHTSISDAEGIELIGLIMEAHPTIFINCEAFFLLLKSRISPLINHHLRLCARENIDFYLLVRLIRTTVIIIKEFHLLLLNECETFLSVFLRLLTSTSLQHSILTLDAFRIFSSSFPLFYFIFENYDNKSRVSLYYNIINSITSLVHSFDPSHDKTANFESFWSFQSQIHGPLDSLLEHHTPSWNLLILPSLATRTLFNYINALSQTQTDQINIDIFTKMIEITSRSVINSLCYLINITQKNDDNSKDHFDRIFNVFYLFSKGCFSTRSSSQMQKIYNTLVRSAPLLSIDFTSSLCSFILPSFRSSSPIGSHSTHKLHQSVQTFEYINFKSLECLFRIINSSQAKLTSSEWLNIFESFDHLNRLLYEQSNNDIVERTKVVFHSSLSSFISTSYNLDYEHLHQMLSALSTLILSSLANIATNDVSDADDSFSFELHTLLNAAPYASSWSVKLFAFVSLLLMLKYNMSRINNLLDILIDHLHCMFNHPSASIRQLASAAYEHIIIEAISHSETDDLSTIQTKLFSPLPKLYLSKYEDTHKLLIVSLLHILHLVGHQLVSGWDYICTVLLNVANTPALPSSSTTISSPIDTQLLSYAFRLIQLISTDYIDNVTSTYSFMISFIDIIYVYASQELDNNLSYASIGALWSVSDQLTRIQNSLEYQNPVESSHSRFLPSIKYTSAGWDEALFHLFIVLFNLSTDKRADVRNPSIKTLFSILTSQGKRMSSHYDHSKEDNIWNRTLHNVLFKLLLLSSSALADIDPLENQAVKHTELGKQKESGRVVLMMVHHSRDSVGKQWLETSSLILTSYCKLFISFFSFLSSITSYMDDFKYYISILNLHIGHHQDNEIILAIINSIHDIFISNIALEASNLDLLFSVIDSIVSNILQATLGDESLNALSAYQTNLSLFDTPNCNLFTALLSLTKDIFASDSSRSVHTHISSRYIIHLVNLMNDILHHFHSSSTNNIKYINPCHRTMIGILESSASMYLPDDSGGDKCRLSISILLDYMASISSLEYFRDFHKSLKCTHAHSSSSLQNNRINTFLDLTTSTLSSIYCHTVQSIRIDVFHSIISSIHSSLTSPIVIGSHFLTSSLIKCLVDIIPTGLDDLTVDNNKSHSPLWKVLYKLLLDFLSISTASILDEPSDLNDSDRIVMTIENLQILLLQLLQHDILPRSSTCPSDIKLDIIHLFDCGWTHTSSKPSFKRACLQSLFLLISDNENSIALLSASVLLERQALYFID